MVTFFIRIKNYPQYQFLSTCFDLKNLIIKLIIIIITIIAVHLKKSHNTLCLIKRYKIDNNLITIFKKSTLHRQSKQALVYFFLHFQTFRKLQSGRFKVK